jgi:DNA-binding LytR/AlgR family response regulator
MTNPPVILIAESDSQVRSYLATLVRISMPRCKIHECETMSDLRTLMQELRPDMVFLDADFLTQSNADMSAILNTSPKPSVVLLADSSLQASDVPDVEHLAVINRPISKSRITQLLGRMHQLPHRIKFNDWYVRPEDIIFVEADGSICALVLADKRIQYGRALKRVEDMLAEQGFERVHRKFLVNLKHVRKVKNPGRRMTLLMSNGAQIPVSRAKHHLFMAWVDRS